MNLTRADLAANITTFNLALLGVLANLHGNVAPEYRPFVDVLMQAISRQVFVVCCAVGRCCSCQCAWLLTVNP